MEEHSEPAPETRAERVDFRIQRLRERRDRLARGERATAGDAAFAAQMLRSAYTRSREAHQQAARACERAAEAHERAAEVLDRLADAGMGDGPVHRQSAGRHRALAADDRARAAEEWNRAEAEVFPLPEGESGEPG